MDVLTGTPAIELDWLKGNKFHEGLKVSHVPPPSL
jgi:hypothetical protein